MGGDDLIALLHAAVRGHGELVRRDDVDGLTISTVDASDVGYETAIVDAEAAWPVQRYESVEAAIAGHAAWIEKAPDLTTVTRIGYGTLLDDLEVTLRRRP